MWIIRDWANNHLFKDKTFPSFEQGWEFLYEQFSSDEDLQDYFVVPFEQ